MSEGQLLVDEREEDDVEVLLEVIKVPAVYVDGLLDEGARIILLSPYVSYKYEVVEGVHVLNASSWMQHGSVLKSNVSL